MAKCATIEAFFSEVVPANNSQLSYSIFSPRP